MDERAISEPVAFDHQAAEALIASFNATASELDQQVQLRLTLASVACEEWRGQHAATFVRIADKCLADTRMLAESLRTAAGEVRRLAELATAEQQRRDTAAHYFAEQDHRNLLQQAGYDVKSFFFGEDKPPNLTPIEPSAVAVAPQWHISGRV